jgi:hypothetical protein
MDKFIALARTPENLVVYRGSPRLFAVKPGMLVESRLLYLTTRPDVAAEFALYDRGKAGLLQLVLPQGYPAICTAHTQFQDRNMGEIIARRNTRIDITAVVADPENRNIRWLSGQIR